jgi:hypothetical protein
MAEEPEEKQKRTPPAPYDPNPQINIPMGAGLPIEASISAPPFPGATNLLGPPTPEPGPEGITPPSLYRPPSVLDITKGGEYETQLQQSLREGKAPPRLGMLEAGTAVARVIDMPGRLLRQAAFGTPEFETGNWATDILANGLTDPLVLIGAGRAALQGAMRSVTLTRLAKGPARLITEAVERPKSFILASPSIREASTLPKAVRELSGSRLASYRSSLDDMAKEAKLRADTIPGIGTWEDGAEEMTAVVFKDYVSAPHLDAMAGQAGRLGYQRATIPFRVERGGAHRVYDLALDMDPEDAVATLAKEGLEYNSVLPTRGGGSRVLIFDDTGNLRKAVENVTEKYGTDAKYYQGTGKFLGGETRAEGLREFAKAQQAFAERRDFGSRLSEGFYNLANRGLRLLEGQRGGIALAGPDMDIVGASLIAMGTKSLPRWKRAMADALSEHADIATLNFDEIYRRSQTIIKHKIRGSVTGKLPTAARLGNLYRKGASHQDWYGKTYQELESIFGPDADMFARFLAATSPNTTTDANVTLAMKAYGQWKAGAKFEGYLDPTIANLNRAIKGQELTGPKVGNFYKNLTGDPDAVTVDRWMQKAFGYKRVSPTDQQYKLIETTIRRQAAEIGVEPRQYQAAIWVGIKKEAPIPGNLDPLEVIIRERLEGTDLLKQLQKEVSAGKPTSATISAVLVASGLTANLMETYQNGPR